MQVTGTIVERRTGVLVDGVRVQAWDPAVVPTEGEPLAEETTSSGAFGMTLGAEGDAEELDVVFRVLVEKTLVAVEATHLVSLRLRRAKATLRVDDPFGTLWRVFVRARDASGEPLVGYEAHAVDVAGRHAEQTTPVGAGGRFALTYPNEPPDLRLWLVGGARTLVPESGVSLTETSVETDLTFTPAAALEIAGRVVERGGDQGASGVVVEVLDRSGRWANPVATSSETDASGAFDVSFARVLDPPESGTPSAPTEVPDGPTPAGWRSPPR